MLLNSLEIKNFKRIASTTVPLTPITVLVGGNNSGKSCVLQAAHLAVGLLQSETEVGVDTFTPDRVRFQPTRDFWDVAHGDRLVEGAAPISVTFRFEPPDGDAFDFSVNASRGAGEAIVLAASEREVSARLLSDIERPYSIYVPGLAGIPLREEFRVDATLARGIASGDANLFLRNVLLRISQNADRTERFNAFLQGFLPGSEIDVRFNQRLHQTIDARLRLDGVSRSIETFGTGVLQYLQILAYVVEYEPALLLLDEPDAHLHANNQRMIASALRKIAAESPTRIILATHSRTIIDALERAEEASFVWIENGTVQPEQPKDRLSMLMALGALDGAERFYSAECAGVVLTEDTDTTWLEALLKANGAKAGQLLVHSYQTSSKLTSATLLAGFISEIKPGVQIIVHRDRDFMTDAEVVRLLAKFKQAGTRYDLFVTRYSDIEHYFVQPQHISETTGLSLQDSTSLVESAIRESQNDFLLKFYHKREQVLRDLYSDDRKSCPSVSDMINDKTLRFDQALGKILIAKVAALMQATYGKKKGDLIAAGSSLEDEALQGLIARIPDITARGDVWPSSLPKRLDHG